MTELRPGAAALALLLALAAVGCRDEAAPQDEAPKESVKAEPAADGPAVQIRRVLDTDTAVFGRFKSQRRSSDYEVWLEGQRTYTAEMSAISLEGTPADFADAFRNHQAAWAAFTGYLTSFTEDDFTAFVARDRGGEPRVKAMRQRYTELNQEISTTWSEVEMVASSFGVGKGPAFGAPPTPVGSTRKLINSPFSDPEHPQNKVHLKRRR